MVKPHEKKISIRSAEKKRLINERTTIEKDQEKRRLNSPIFILLGLTIITIPLTMSSSAFIDQYSGVLIVYGLFSVGLGIIFRPLHSNRIRIQQIENQLDLISIQADIEIKAEKLFKNHQFELQRFYDSILSHSKTIFIVGVICIALGFGIIGIALYLVSGIDESLKIDEPKEQIILAVITALGNILTAFIGTIFLRMFTQISDSLSQFFRRLTESNKLFLANYFSSKIGDENKREELLMSIAKKISTSNSDEEI